MRDCGTGRLVFAAAFGAMGVLALLAVVFIVEWRQYR